MKRLSLISCIILTSLTFHVSAQQDTLEPKIPFGQNWYIGAGTGSQVLLSADAGRLSFPARLSPDLSLVAGKRLSPYLRAQFRFGGYLLKGPQHHRRDIPGRSPSRQCRVWK